MYVLRKLHKHRLIHTYIQTYMVHTTYACMNAFTDRYVHADPHAHLRENYAQIVLGQVVCVVLLPA